MSKTSPSVTGGGGIAVAICPVFTDLLPGSPTMASSSVSSPRQPNPPFNQVIDRHDHSTFAVEAIYTRPSSKALGKRRAPDHAVDVAPVSANRPSKRAKGQKPVDQVGKEAINSKAESAEGSASATTTTRRVQPARSRRGGIGIGTTAVDQMILESRQRASMLSHQFCHFNCLQ